jgi:drug/metabolite transporter (DMT)-like permease
MLLVTTVIFWVVPASYWLLKRKFSIWQLISLVIGAGGIVFVFIADHDDEESKWLGNVLAICSALSFAGSTVFQELVLQKASTDTYVSRFSLTAAIVSAIVCETGVNAPTCFQLTKHEILFEIYCIKKIQKIEGLSEETLWNLPQGRSLIEGGIVQRNYRPGRAL